MATREDQPRPSSRLSRTCSTTGSSLGIYPSRGTVGGGFARCLTFGPKAQALRANAASRPFGAQSGQVWRNAAMKRLACCTSCRQSGERKAQRRRRWKQARARCRKKSAGSFIVSSCSRRRGMCSTSRATGTVPVAVPRDGLTPHHAVSWSATATTGTGP